MDCQPPDLPTVHTLEQFDVAFTAAYVCTNQLNAQLEEIRQRCLWDAAASEGATIAARRAASSVEDATALP